MTECSGLQMKLYPVLSQAGQGSQAKRWLDGEINGRLYAEIDVFLWSVR